MNCWPGSMDYGKREAGDVRLGICGPPGGWEVVGLAHLILLGELEAVVGLESFRVFRHVPDGDGRVAGWLPARGRADPPMWPVTRRGQAGEGRGQGVLYGVSLQWTELLGLEGWRGRGRFGVGPVGAEEPRPWRRSTRWSLPHPPQAPDNQLGRQVLGSCPAGLQAPSASWQETGK